MSGAEASGFERELDDRSRDKLSEVHLFDIVDSTSSFLLRQAPPAPGKANVALADDQSAGRGRHDRRWVSEKGASLCLSLAYTFATPPETLLGLTPVMGVAANRAFAATGLTGVQLKWPNDLVFHDCKLGGLLAESQLKADRQVTVVAGVGINLDLPSELLEASATDWAHRAIDLQSAMPSPPSRDELAALITAELLYAFEAFGMGRAAPLMAEWRERDWLLGKDIVVEEGNTVIQGEACGIDDDGALLVRTADGAQRIITGSVRLSGPYSY